MSLAVSAALTLSHFRLDVAFEVPGALTAIFGASGSGKSTLINIIAGLVRPQQGQIIFNERVLLDVEQNIAIPPHQRGIGYIFQDARLFPHLTVKQNLFYGHWFRKSQHSFQDVSRIIDMLGLGPLLHQHPRILSGGERQRVAIGRALLSSPQLLLMDEPLSSLDERRKQEILPYIEQLRDSFHLPILYVSHSLTEVSRLAQHILVLSQGRLVASGAAADILQDMDSLTPEDPQEGFNALDMRVENYNPAYDITRLTSPAGTVYVTGRHGTPGDAKRIHIRARDILIARSAPHDLSAQNVLAGHIVSINPLNAASVRITLDSCGTRISARITAQSAALLGLKIADPVFAIVKTVSLTAAG